VSISILALTVKDDRKMEDKVAEKRSDDHCG